MAASEVTYLELSEAGASTHKFYEITVENTTVTVRYGRIGDAGAVQTSAFDTPVAAAAFAQKKIKEKTGKGYAPAVRGVRQKRTVTRRTIEAPVSSPGPSARVSAAAAPAAPLLWKFDTGSSHAFGIYVDEASCWVGNEAGRVFQLDHAGNLLQQFQLPEGVKCIVSDGDWIYVGCDDGNVYDLTGKFPRAAYEIDEKVDIYWLDIANAMLAVSDANGTVTVINYEDEEQWAKKSAGKAGWMVRCDERGFVYQGHSRGVTAYDGLNGGNILWERPTLGAVYFGWREGDLLYAGTHRSKLHCFTREGAETQVYTADNAIFSNSAAEGGKYVFAGDNNNTLYCFSGNGERLWKLATTCGSAYSMQYHQEKLYVVTTKGVLACIDASEKAILEAKAGVVPEVTDIKAPPKVASIATDLLQTRTAAETGVTLECYREGTQLRMRVLSSGYHSDWHVQFPRNLRNAGARYLVDEVRESAQGGFYRTYGNIYRLN